MRHIKFLQKQTRNFTELSVTDLYKNYTENKWIWLCNTVVNLAQFDLELTSDQCTHSLKKQLHSPWLFFHSAGCGILSCNQLISITVTKRMFQASGMVELFKQLTFTENILLFKKKYLDIKLGIKSYKDKCYIVIQISPLCNEITA